MARATVNFRGEEVGVIYNDHGYEPDTNAHEIDRYWEDQNLTIEKELTDEEMDNIDAQIREISYDRQSDHYEGDC